METKTAGEAGVSLKNVTKRIQGRTIIDQLSFTVKPGEVFGLLGPNGAGKTTTIRMMVGLNAMDHGDISINGASIRKNFKAAIRQIGAVAENPALYGFLSGYQNLVHFARMQPGVSTDRIEEVIQVVGLQNRIHDRVETYSLGMRQRIGVAQALLHRPPVLILDEPTNGLDPAAIRNLREYLQGLAREEGASVIVSSHLLAEMEVMCDRFAIIDHGKLLQIQTMADSAENEEMVYLIEVDDGALAVQQMGERLPGVKTELEGKRLLVWSQRAGIPEVIRTLAAHGIQVFSAVPRTKSLEDRFMEITGEEYRV
ncbi:MAG: ABC transporter ATP-binding protein [Solirubrobacterales bacterium]